MIPLENVLVADPVSDKCLQLLKEYGVNATPKYKLPKEQLLTVIKDYDGLIVRSETKVTREVLSAGSKLKAVGRAGTGVDNIDIQAATEKGVIVLNTPGGNSISACELTCALISALARNVGAGCISMKEGRWDRKLFMGSELMGKTLGVIGLGRIGREVATRMQGYGMKTIGFDPIVSAEDASAFNVTKVELSELWPSSDYITVHTPLIPQTKNLINNETFNNCKRGVKIVNVARGGIVNEADLLEALKDGRCGGAGLDVFTEEPPKSAHLWDLIKHPKVLATPHLGASTEEAQIRVAVEIAEQLIALAKPSSGFEVTGAVNAPILASMRDPNTSRWLDLATQMGLMGVKLFPGRPLQNLSLSATSMGDKEIKFLEMGVLKGVLSSRDPGANLINISGRAKDANLRSVACFHKTTPGAEGLELSMNDGTTKHTLTGFLNGDLVCLKSIDDAVFTCPPILKSNGFIMSSSDAASVKKTIEGMVTMNGISCLSIAKGSTNWVYTVS